MKIPQCPPPVGELLDEAQKTGRLHALYDKMFGQVAHTHRGKYLHWDRLKYYKPPAGLSHREWWLVMKTARLQLLKQFPMKDAKGDYYRFGLPDPTMEHLLHIDQDAAGRIEVSDHEVASPETRDKYLVHSLVEEAITSSQLEGAATTRLVAKEMMRTGRKPRDRDEMMIVNNYAAMEQIRAIRNDRLTPETVLELHEIVTRGTLDDPSAAGRLRKVAERVDVVTQDNAILYTPPGAAGLEGRMKAMCDFANGETPDYFVHPVIRAILTHFWLACDHPFVDGNGRCARTLFYWVMLNKKYWLCEFLSISEIIKKASTKYGTAFLYAETDGNDATYFILYHLEVIRQAIEKLHTYVARKSAAIRQTEQLVRKSALFNHRQLDLLSHALRHRDATYTIDAHMNSHRVAYQTARTDLLELADTGLFEMRKIKNKYRFNPAPLLEDKLKRVN